MTANVFAYSDDRHYGSPRLGVAALDFHRRLFTLWIGAPERSCLMKPTAHAVRAKQSPGCLFYKNPEDYKRPPYP